MVIADVMGGTYPKIGHATWNDMHLADFVMPFFLFVVGFSIALSMRGFYSCGMGMVQV